MTSPIEPTADYSLLPPVTVIIPCHDAGSVLAEAVESATGQTLPGCQVIVVDDGSRDRRTLATLEKVRLSGVTVIRQERAGPGAARNTAIAAAETPFILPLDGDDRLSSDAARIASTHLSADDDVGIVAGAMRLFGAIEEVRYCAFTGPDSMVDSTTIPISAFRKSDWATVGGYPTGIRRGEDWAFWMRILRLGRKVKIVDDIWYEYRIWDAQESSQQDPVASALGSNFVMLENRDLYVRNAEWLIDELAQTRLMLAQFRRTYASQERLRARVRRLVGRR